MIVLKIWYLKLSSLELKRNSKVKVEHRNLPKIEKIYRFLDFEKEDFFTIYRSKSLVNFNSRSTQYKALSFRFVIITSYWPSVLSPALLVFSYNTTWWKMKHSKTSLTFISSDFLKNEMTSLKKVFRRQYF